MSKKKEIKKLKKKVKELYSMINELERYIAKKEVDREHFEKVTRMRLDTERSVRNVMIRTVNRHSEEIAQMKNEVEADHIDEIKED